jgi:hypothetical protein
MMIANAVMKSSVVLKISVIYRPRRRVKQQRKDADERLGPEVRLLKRPDSKESASSAGEPALFVSLVVQNINIKIFRCGRRSLFVRSIARQGIDRRRIVPSQRPYLRRRRRWWQVFNCFFLFVSHFLSDCINQSIYSHHKTNYIYNNKYEYA